MARSLAVLLVAALALVALAAADLVIAPPSGNLLVPDAYIGYTTQTQIVVTNPTNNTYQLSSWAFGNTADTQWGLQLSSASVDPVSSSVFTILLTPTALGPVSNTFSFTTSDPDAPGASYNLSAVVTLTPALKAVPPYTILYFGDGSPSSHKPATIEFTNIGNSTLTLQGILGGVNNMSFSFSPSSLALAPAQSATVQVECHTSSYGALLGTLTFTTNDPLNLSYVYQLSCWSVHMGRDVALGFLYLFVFWLVFAILLWALFAFKQ